LSIASLVRSASTGQVSRWSTTTRSVNAFGIPERALSRAVASPSMAVRGSPRLHRRLPARPSPSLRPSKFAIAASCLA
jgi:hypothetical protein